MRQRHSDNEIGLVATISAAASAGFVIDEIAKYNSTAAAQTLMDNPHGLYVACYTVAAIGLGKIAYSLLKNKKVTSD